MSEFKRTQYQQKWVKWNGDGTKDGVKFDCTEIGEKRWYDGGTSNSEYHWHLMNHVHRNEKKILWVSRLVKIAFLIAMSYE